MFTLQIYSICSEETNKILKVFNIIAILTTYIVGSVKRMATLPHSSRAWP